MPARPTGVYQDGRGKWYFKVTVGRDPLTGKRDQVTRRGFATMAEAARERREVLAKIDHRQLAPSSAGLKVSELLDLYLDGIDADQNLALKTRFDYRQYAEDYIRPYIGDRRVRDVTPDVILAWQRKLLKEGGAKKKLGKDGKPGPGKPLSPNTVNRIRAPLSATFKLAVRAGMIPINPLLQAPRPKPQRKIPKLLVTRGGPQVPGPYGRRPHVADLGLPPRLRPAHRRAGVLALAQRGPEEPPGAHRRLRLDPRVRHDALERQEPRVRPHDRARRRPGRRPAQAEGAAEDRAAWPPASGSSPTSSSPGPAAVSITR